MTLARQLVVLLVLLLTLVFIGTFLISVDNTRAFLQQQLASHAEDTATSLGLSISSHLAEDDSATIESMVDAIFDRGFYRSIRVEKMDGTGVVERQLPVRIDGVPEWFVRILPLETPLGQASVMDGWVQAGRVLVQSNPGLAYAQLWSNVTGMLRWFLTSAVVMSLLGVLLLKLVLRPLRSVEDQASAICERRFPVLDRLPRTRELRRIVEAMNRLSLKVKQMLTESEQLADDLRRQANQDPVTGLANKRHFMDTLSHLVDSPEEFPSGLLCLIQLDDFKGFNDAHGYQAGDRLLRALAVRLREVAETLPAHHLARISGADFALVVDGLSEEEGRSLGARLSAQLARLHDSGDIDRLDVGHVGIACFDGSQSVSELLSQADMALQAARGESANAWHLIVPRHSERPHIRGATEWRGFLQRALDRDRLVLQLQPVVSCPGGEAMHHEVLVRIREGDDLINAGLFMPQVERWGLAAQVDRAVLTRVLTTATDGPERRYAVNLSPSSLKTPGFVSWLGDQLQRHPQAAQRLIVELPEYRAVTMLGRIGSLIELLERHGTQFSLDHFGRSFGSFAYLQSLRAHYLKLDGSYLRSLEQNLDNQFFLQALAKIAHGLEIQVIAESVETETQWKLLPSLNIDGAQGYFIGRPE